MTLSGEEQQRYARHLVLPQIGSRGQQMLGSARVLVVGAGGLGSPALMYLAAAGVGTLGIVDRDVVEISNLQRQILFTTEDLGKGKAGIAASRLAAMNPGIRIDVHAVRIGASNAMEIIQGYDIVLDCTDNFGTRYLLNDACVMLSKPDIFGTVYRFEGQIAVFDAARGSCLRCLIPVPPPPELVPGCADGGVIGAIAGIVGASQALEAVKIIVGAGRPITGQLLSINGLTNEYIVTSIHKDPACPVCGDHPKIRSLTEDERYCDTGAAGGGMHDADTISTQELAEMIRKGEPHLLLDVRTVEERAAGHIGGILIPLSELQGRWAELDTRSKVIVYCKGDTRSARAVEFLRTNGFTDVRRLHGGFDAYIRESGGEPR